MSASQMVPMISPDGQPGDIPYEKMHEAMTAGFKPAVIMKSPDGSKSGYIPANKTQEASKAGFKIVPFEQQETQHEGFWSAIGRDLAGMVSGGLPHDPVSFATSAIQQGAETAANDFSRKQEGRSLPYRIASPAVQIATGANVRGMEEAANAGDVSGVLGHAAAVPTAMAATAGAAKVAPKIVGATEGMRTPPVARYNIPEAANLPVKAISGAEDVFRASAPTGSNPQFRANVYAAAGDLAEIGRKTQLAEAKGGIIRPDMRVRATVDALNNHLQEMYQTERAPQIARNAQAPVAVKISGDAASGLEYLAKNAGTEADRALAVKASSAPALTIAETDQLARLTNKQLLDFESMTPSERATVEGSNRRLSSLKALDQTLTSTLNDQLTMRGETGVQAYERRYAALSQVRDQLQSRMNAVELNQPGIIKKFGKTVGSVVTGSKSGIASASQAAVADVNIGRSLERGFKSLADSGIEPQRSGAMPTKRIAGQLPAGTMELPSSMEPILPNDTMKTVKRVVRDPATGKMKIQYVTGNK